MQLKFLLQRMLLHFDSNCQYCGACVDICPTGVYSAKKTRWTRKGQRAQNSVCGFCSVNCGFDYYTEDDVLIEGVPSRKAKTNRGQSCVVGRFCILNLFTVPSV